MPTLLCVPIMVTDEATALRDAAAARDAGADLVELRIDEFFSGSLGGEGRLDDREVRSVLRLVAACPLPCIVTCRLASEGGHYDGDEAARVALLERLGTAAPASERIGETGPREHPPRYIDVEFAAYSASANIRQKIGLAVEHARQRRDVSTGLILSLHDLSGRPRDLLRRVMDMGAEPAASVVKVAYHARSVRDNLELFDLLRENAAGRPMIALGMGRFGLMSRVLAPKFGGFLTFAALRQASATAPGQPTVRELVDLYNFRSITSRTRVYGLVGWPVEHSLSPLVHNAGFEAYWPDTWQHAQNSAEAETADEFDGVYLPLPVPPEYEHFKATVSALIDHPRLDFGGCSVTAPHKRHLVRLALEGRGGKAEGDVRWELDEISERCGAANTLVVERDGAGLPVAARVTNTDASAGAAWIGAALGGDLRGRRIGVFGAGGAARSIAAGVLRAGARVAVFNRSEASAEALVRDLSQLGEVAPDSLDGGAAAPCDAFVNCTPVGMRGGPDEGGTPVAVERLRASSPEAVVMDTVYAPLATPLLQAAALAGLRTADGLGMFVRQAGEQFIAWTGRPAPMQLFERICRDALSEPGAVR